MDENTWTDPPESLTELTKLTYFFLVVISEFLCQKHGDPFKSQLYVTTSNWVFWMESQAIKQDAKEIKKEMKFSVIKMQE